MTTDRDTHVEDMTIRLLDGADLEAVGRLAERDSSAPPPMPLLGAAIDGVLIAAITLDGSFETIADPFRPTADVMALLEGRARQLHEASSSRAGRRRRSRGILPRGGGSLPGSPPGAGGRLLRL